MPHGQQSTDLKNESQSSTLQKGLTSVYSLLSWGTSSALRMGYSAYQYTKRILQYEQAQIRREESKVKHVLSSGEQALAENISNTLKEIVASVILSSGASWPTIAYVTWGMLPKDMVVKFGATLFGSYFPTVIDAQHLTGNTLTVMNGFFPTSWLQLGCKKGMDATVHFVGSKQLLQFYKDYHVGERIWLWMGVANNIHHNLKILAPEYTQIEVTGYRAPGITGTVIDTSQCRSKWLFWQECHLKERKIKEQNVLTHAIRSGIIKSRNDGEFEPVSYAEVSDIKSYRANYENGRLVQEVNTLHLPKLSENLVEGMPEVEVFSIQATYITFFMAIVVLSRQIKLGSSLGDLSGNFKFNTAVVFAIAGQLPFVGANKDQRTDGFNSLFNYSPELNSFAGKNPVSNSIEPCRVPHSYNTQSNSKKYESSSEKILSDLAGRIGDIEERSLDGGYAGKNEKLFPSTDDSTKGNGAMFIVSFLNWRMENIVMAQKYSSQLRNAEIQAFEAEFGKIPSFMVAADNPHPAWYLQNQYMMQKINEKYGHLINEHVSSNSKDSHSMSIEMKNLDQFSLLGSKNSETSKYNLGLSGRYSSEPPASRYSLGLSDQSSRSSFEEASGAKDEIFKPVYEMASKLNWRSEDKKSESSSSSGNSNGQLSEGKSAGSSDSITWTGPSSFEDKSEIKNTC